MVTALDTKLRPKTVELIEKYGKSVTWTVTSGGTYVPATGSTSGATSTPYTVKVTPPEPYTSKFIDGDTIRVGDALIYLAAQDLAFTPAENQHVTVDGVVWVVVRVNAIYSGDLVCLWEAGLRR